MFTNFPFSWRRAGQKGEVGLLKKNVGYLQWTSNDSDNLQEVEVSKFTNLLFFFSRKISARGVKRMEDT